MRLDSNGCGLSSNHILVMTGKLSSTPTGSKEISLGAEVMDVWELDIYGCMLTFHSPSRVLM